MSSFVPTPLKMKLDVDTSRTISENPYKPVGTTPAIKQEFTETEDVKFTRTINKASKGGRRSSATIIKREVSPDISFDLTPVYHSKALPTTKQEESPSFNVHSSNKERVSSVPSNRVSSSRDANNIVLKTSPSSALSIQIKKDSSLDHKPLSLDLHYPLSQLDGNVGGYIPMPATPKDFADNNMKMKDEFPSIKMPASAPFQASYGDVGDFDNEDDHLRFATNSNGYT